MIREILKYPDPILSKVAEEIAPGEEADRLLQDLTETCLDQNGLGLAAPQIGQSVRAIVITRNDGTMLGILNPHIRRRSGISIYSKEGCLSVPGKEVIRRRAYSVVVVGEGIKVELKDRESCVAQHEIDHLNGRTIADE